MIPDTEKFLQILSDVFKLHLGSETSIISLEGTGKPDLTLDNKMVSKIKIEGAIELQVYLASGMDSLKVLIEKVFGADFDEVIEEDLVQNSLDEFLNLIIANSTQPLAEAGLTIDMFPPELSSVTELTGNDENATNQYNIVADNISLVLKVKY